MLREVPQRKEVQRGEREPHAQPADVEHEEDVPVGGVERETAGQPKARRQQQDARRREQQGFDIAREVTRYGRQHSLYEPHGQEYAPGRQRRVAQPALHVERQQVGAAQHADREERQHGHRNPEVALPEQAQLQQRRRAAQLRADEVGERHGRHGETADHRGRRPAVVVGRRVAPRQRVDRQRHEERDGHESPPVERVPRRAFPLLLDEERQQDGEHPHGDVHVENPVPAVCVDQVAAQQGAERDRRGGGHCPQAERQAALLGAEFAGHDRQSQRLDDAAADALQGACPDQKQVARGFAAEPRPEREERQPQDIDAFVPEAVGEPTRRGEHDGHGDHVGGDDPFGRRDADAESRHDGRQPDVDYRHVQHGHERPEHDHAQDPPFVSVALPDMFAEGRHRRAIRQKKCHAADACRMECPSFCVFLSRASLLPRVLLPLPPSVPLR